jgi:peroxiredoxin
MKMRYVLGGAVLAMTPGIFWGVRHLTPPAREASISDRVGVLPYLPRDKWAGSVARLAVEIPRMPTGPDKRQLIRVFADRVTERGADHAVLQAIADSMVEVINGSPVYDRGPIFWSLAHLTHYDRVTVTIDDPQYRAALDKLEAQDKQRVNADFKLSDIEGETWSLRDLHGKVVLVNFWATWCPDCRAEMPDLQALTERFAPQGLVILAISDETRETVAPFVARKKYTFPILLDPGSDVNKLYNIQGIPESFLYDRNGKLVAQAVEQQTRGQFLDMLKAAGLVG